MLTLIGLLKLAALFPSLERALQRWWRRRSVRQAIEERDLWLRARWDLAAAARLRRRLVKRAVLFENLDLRSLRPFQEHPELITFHEKMCEGVRADIAKLDDMVRHIFGANVSAAL